MRRTLLALGLVTVLGLSAAACNDSSETSTSASSSTAVSLPAGGGGGLGNGGGGGGGGGTGGLGGASTTTTQAKKNTPACQSLATFLSSELIADKAKDKDQAEKDKVISGMEAVATKAKAAEPTLAADIDVRVAYSKKVVSGETPSEIEKAAAEKSLKALNEYRFQNCPVGQQNQNGNGGNGDKPTTTKAG